MGATQQPVARVSLRRHPWGIVLKKYHEDLALSDARRNGRRRPAWAETLTVDVSGTWDKRLSRCRNHTEGLMAAIMIEAAVNGNTMQKFRECYPSNALSKTS